MMISRTLLIRAALGLLASGALSLAGPALAKHHKPDADAVNVDEPLAAAGADQLAAADRALLGNYACEFNQSVSLERNALNPGYLNLKYKKKLWVVKPVLSITGALRSEDIRGQTLFLQTAYKSMLLDVKQGHPLVEDCVHPDQARAQEQAAASPITPAISDTAAVK